MKLPGEKSMLKNMKIAVWACLPLVASLLSSCQSMTPEEAAIDHYVRSQVLADKGDRDAALAELRDAVAADPSLAVAHSAAGDIYRRQGNNEQAAKCYESACKADPYSFSPHYKLGVTYQGLADLAKTADKVQFYLREAVRVYLRAITIKDDDFDANTNLAACYLQMGKYELAARYALAAVRINPKSPFAHSNLAIIYDCQNDLSHAISEYNASLELDNNQPNVLMNKGSAYLRMNVPSAAIKDFEIAAKMAPQDSTPYEQIGLCYCRSNSLDKALAAYSKAVEINPKSAAGYRGMGMAYLTKFVEDNKQTDLRDKGLAAWIKSLEIQPDQQDLARLLQKYTPKQTAPQL
jgi:tetratricopeptide (TPR) repeat protein